jgi:hypothetical protein
MPAPIPRERNLPLSCRHPFAEAEGREQFFVEAAEKGNMKAR